jgi:hypothetical protein
MQQVMPASKKEPESISKNNVNVDGCVCKEVCFMYVTDIEPGMLNILQAVE